MQVSKISASGALTLEHKNNADISWWTHLIDANVLKETPDDVLPFSIINYILLEE